MRFSVVATSAISLVATTTSAASCGRWKNGITKAYTVEAWGVPDRAATCGGLWDNLKRFTDCAVPSLTDCSGENGYLSWSFQAAAGCNGGMVESTWWEATKNQYGGIHCP